MNDFEEAMIALHEQDTKKLCKLLKDNSKLLRTKNHRQQTLLHIAAEIGKKELIQLILEAEKMLYHSSWRYRLFSFFLPKSLLSIAQDEKGNTPLHLIAKHSDKDVLKLMIEINRSSNLPRWLSFWQRNPFSIKNSYGQTVLDTAIIKGNFPLIHLLIKDALVELKDKWGKTNLLHYAASKGYTSSIEKLLNNDPLIEVNQCDKKGRTALYKATYNGHLEVIEFLHQRGVVLYATSPSSAIKVALKDRLYHKFCIDRKTSLPHLAIQKGYQGALTVFLNAGVNPDLHYRDASLTLLDQAVYCHKPEIIHTLLKKGATVNNRSKEGLPISLPKDFNDIPESPVMTYWPDNFYRDLYHVYPYGYSSPHYYCKYYNYETERYHQWVQNREKDKELQDFLFKKDKNGETFLAQQTRNHELNSFPLYLAIKHNNIKCAHLLMTSGANVKTIFNEETKLFKEVTTPLHLAIMQQSIKMCELLITQCPALLTIPDHYGYSPLDIALFKGAYSLVPLLFLTGSSVKKSTALIAAYNESAPRLHLPHFTDLHHLQAQCSHINWISSGLFQSNVLNHLSPEKIITILKAAVEYRHFSLINKSPLETLATMAQIDVAQLKHSFLPDVLSPKEKNAFWVAFGIGKTKTPPMLHQATESAETSFWQKFCQAAEITTNSIVR